ncbi:hypothetical protein [Hymenobacter bucti]|uniref:Uncharacterized protein n=1 Tax=Hymenobacter bucti TaxID=1844114 RepID=A0ABW4QYJ0_9BACT
MTTESISSIWISPGITSGETPETHYNVGNTDVIVYFSDNSSYVATFFTYKNIDRIVKNYQQTGEGLSGKYFWASDMLLVDKIDRASIEAVVYDLLEEGSFLNVFRRVV